MRTPMHTRLPRRLRSALTLLAATGMMLVGLPATAHAAPGDYAKITTGKRCDETHLKKTYPTTPPLSGAPMPDAHWVAPGPDGEYYYNNEFKGFENVPAPTQADLDAAGSSRAEIDAWDAKYAKSHNIDDMKNAIYARYNRHKKTSASPKPFRDWVPRYLINGQANSSKGGVFERKTVQDFNLIGPDWLCEVTIEIRDKDGKLIASRRYDAYNQRSGELGEFKSNGKYKPNQYKADQVILRHKDDKYDFTKSRMSMFAGEKASDTTVKRYNSLNNALKSERSTVSNQVRIVEKRATARALWPQTKWTKTYPVFNPRPNTGTQGPINDIAWQSGRTPAEGQRIQKDFNKINTRSALGRGPGGVDFSTLQLQYVGNPVKGKALDYSFKADFTPDEDTDPGWGGKASLQLASDSMFTWLALTPDKFWVNLNPDQPDKIMDSTFASTDAGRILLEADLAMKADFAHQMNPDKNPEAKNFWDGEVKDKDGIPCFPEVRLWIEPKPAKVREQDGGIYILDAPLKVSTEWMDMAWHAPGARTCTFTEDQKRQSERLLRQYVMPGVDKAVNTGDAYKDLRRVYASRVAAEWIRQQDAKKPTDFHPIINSNNVKRWPLRAPNATWTKQSVYDRYMKSLREGIEWFKLEYGGQAYNQGVGGVDFSKAPKRNVTRVEFTTQHRTLPRTTKDSVRSQTSARDSDTTYLGGSGSIDTSGGGGTPTPPPTPAPTHTGGGGKPSPQPTGTSTPAPQPTATLSPTGAPKPPKDDDGGGLADTGTQVLTVAGIAAALLAAGAALVWWRRRHTTDS
ncbi:LPXTG cell wall anchor domain-containing protein [Streptomyces sp. NPDC052301]|uniref:LPXTG cell wall anchor domain-containing protein n=1 Tax=Streptomyces sp. NPDC052301 TaxID=3365687 RepID=UPI0037CDC926